MEARDLVEASLYGSEEEVIGDALRHLLRARPDARVQLAAYQYQHHELSLAKAAALAGVSWAQMKHILVEKGIPLRLGAETPEEASEELREIRRHLESQIDAP